MRYSTSDTFNSSSCNKINVLVVAPMFPAIHQPWIDTYLEQLLQQTIEPVIFSSNSHSLVYSSKIDRLGLREKVIPFFLDRKLIVTSVIKQIFLLKNLPKACLITKNITESKLSFVRDFFVTLHFLDHIERFKSCEIIHSHSETLAYRFLYLALLKDIPLVLTFHGLPPIKINQLSSLKRKILYRYAAKVLVNTEFAKRQVCSLGCAPEKVTVIPQGLSIGEFPFFARRPPTALGPVKLLSVGRYHKDKGQVYSLLALRRLLNEGVSARWTFVGVGPERSRLERFTNLLNLKDHVDFSQGLSSEELKLHYQSADLFVLASVSSARDHVETQGVVLQEAQASGCIPIATRVGGIPECIHHQEDALLVRQRSSRELSKAIQFMLANPEIWDKYQRAGRRNVEENYCASTIGRKMSIILRSTANGLNNHDIN